MASAARLPRTWTASSPISLRLWLQLTKKDGPATRTDRLLKLLLANKSVVMNGERVHDKLQIAEEAITGDFDRVGSDTPNINLKFAVRLTDQVSSSCCKLKA